MSPWRGILAAARGSLILLGSVLLTTLLAVAFGAHAVNTLRSEQQQQKNRIADLQHNLQDKRQTQDFLLRHAEAFQRLAARGMLREPDRDHWIGQLLAAHRQLDLPPTLKYTLPPPRPAAADISTAASSPAGTAWLHELEFSLENIHEAELLTLIDRFGSSITEPFRIQHCRLSQARAEGLSAQCTLRFFSLLPRDAPQP
ncbi:exported protein of unknown function [Sterolibacterium denitrificans]|uniref:Uncharacterized protein n=1 Tax=Sterolibacterium denitrificans TaxID=157592 RepID=A0A7Z7HQ53_9PROT|nr:hypothetical protein [Sterolibacterium denitrificans]SMB24243.1 exported protein of unknown function [Sterolibacterium denitrificans]